MRERILAEIKESGPIPFDRFMDLALYDDGGYFGSGDLRSVKAGDFLTSPEVSTVFGETLAGYVANERKRIGEPFQVVEVAAGSGSLLKPLLDQISVTSVAVEVSPAAREHLERTLPETHVTSLLPDTIRGVLIANELIDNLPMALAQKTNERWRERWVGAVDGRLELVDGEARPEVVDWLDSYAGEVPDGGWVEVQLEAASWMREVLARLEAGSVVVIDYGDTAENLLPRRQDGTLRTYRAHHLGPHPLDEPGETDITADVNFTALIEVAREAGAVAILHRQDDFLNELGLRERLSEARRQELLAARDGDERQRLRLRTLKTEIETLLHPRGLGDFRVLVCTKIDENARSHNRGRR